MCLTAVRAAVSLYVCVCVVLSGPGTTVGANVLFISLFDTKTTLVACSRS